MGLLTELTTTLGVPASGLIAAAALYHGSKILEKEASPKAKADIARVLSSPSWSPQNRPSRLVEAMFKFTFGMRQISIACVIRSAVASVAFLLSILFASLVIDGPFLHATVDGEYCSLFAHVYGSLTQTICSTGHDPGDLLRLALFLSIIPDYVSIAKARLIISLIARSESTMKLICLVCVDLLLCFWISWVTMTVYWYVNVGWLSPELNLSFATLSFLMVYKSLIFLFDDLMGRGQGWSVYQWFIGSTVLTSIWTIFVLASFMLAKLILPLEYVRRITKWLFVVDRHPIRAIGFVAAGLVFLGSVITAVLR
jgi:hypothetical protein